MKREVDWLPTGFELLKLGQGDGLRGSIAVANLMGFGDMPRNAATLHPLQAGALGVGARAALRLKGV